MFCRGCPAGPVQELQEPGCRHHRDLPRLSANPRRIPARGYLDLSSKGYHSGVAYPVQVQGIKAGSGKVLGGRRGQRRRTDQGQVSVGPAWRTGRERIKERRILTEAKASVQQFLDFTYSLKRDRGGPDLCSKRKLRSCGGPLSWLLSGLS